MAGASDYRYKYDKTKSFIYKKGIDFRHYKLTPEKWDRWDSSMTPSRAAYFAGLFDGDGSFSTRHNSLHAYIKLQDLEPLESLHEIYGATIYGLSQPFNPKHKTLYKISLYGVVANHFMQCVCPWLSEKRKLVTNLLNRIGRLPNYHPYKVPFPKKDKFIATITPLMCYVAGFFDAEGSAKIHLNKNDKTLHPRINFTNTELRPLKKLKKFLESWPFTFKPTITTAQSKGKRKDGSPNKRSYKLLIPHSQHLLFMKMFSPIMHLERKKRATNRFEMLRTVDDHIKTRRRVKRLKRKYGSKR